MTQISVVLTLIALILGYVIGSNVKEEEILGTHLYCETIVKQKVCWNISDAGVWEEATK